MDREIKFFTVGLIFVGINFLIAACASIPPAMKPDGIAWEAGSFSSNAERIDFISIREHGMASNGWMMTAKNIHWSALQNEFDVKKFHLTLTKGHDLDGTQLNADISRWKNGDNGTANLFAYIKALP